MKDMMEILRKAKCKSTFENQEDFQALLTQMQLADAELRLAFVREKYNFQKIEQVLHDFEIVFTENYDLDEWSVDINHLKKEICNSLNIFSNRFIVR